MKVTVPVITIVQGETLRLRVRLRARRTGAPVDLTGAAVTAEIRRTWAATEPIGVLAVLPDNPAGGTYYLVLDRAASGALPAGRHIFEVTVEFAAGEVRKLPRGIFAVLPGGRG